MIEAIQVLLMFAYANLVWAAWATWGRASAARFCARGATPPHRHGLVWHGVRVVWSCAIFRLIYEADYDKCIVVVLVRMLASNTLACKCVHGF